MPSLMYRVRGNVRRARFVFVSWGTIIPLLRAVRSPHLTEIWIGDSHAMCFNGPRTPARLSRGAEGQFVIYLGPRLMFSLARDGFPLWVRVLAGVIRRLAPAGTVVLVFCAGEIDIRCHLVPRARQSGDGLAFVESYVEQCRRLTSTAGAQRALLVTPPPPSITCPVQPEFPVNGSIEERIEMRDLLLRKLSEASKRSQAVSLDAIDPGPALCDAHRGLDGGYTDDGCHTNAAGVLATRQIMRDVLAPE